MVTVYDVALEGRPVLFYVLPALLFGLAGLTFLVAPDDWIYVGFDLLNKKTARKVGAVVFFAAAIGVPLLLASQVSPRRQAQLEALRTGKYLVAEGKLVKRDFIRPNRGPHREIFSVGNTSFEIVIDRKYGFQGFFETTEQLQGLGGSIVRVAYLPGTPPQILRVEAEASTQKTRAPAYK